MTKNFADLVNIIRDNIFGPLVVLIMGIALIYFLWGVLKYIQAEGDENSKAEGAKMMTWGIFALFVMVSVWGLVRVLENTFRLDNTEPNAPSFNTRAETGKPGGQAPFNFRDEIDP